MDTLYLAPLTWDLCLDSSGNIAQAAEPYSLAQDAASAIRTFLGEVYYDTTLGVPYFTEILGQNPPIELIRADFVAQALLVPDVVAAKVYFSSVSNRAITGQVHVTNNAGLTTVANF